LAGALAELLASVPIWKRIFATLDERPSLIESPNAKVVAPSATRGAIELEDVSFLYPGQATPATVGVSVLIEAGQRVAIVGPTGAGKSTLVALIARFADPASGRVLLDGQDLRDLTLESLARAIGVVFQDNFLFNAPLSENLRYAAPDASDDELWGALRSAKLDVVVRGLPEQLETIVGERGFRLSGGEQQRVAIARAILKHPPVLILDEATSNLDRIVEQEVQQALERLFAGRTTVVIAHRLVTIRDADMILVMDAGRIAERGSHAELIMQDGLYARLYEAQASSFV
jgi:ATP-binding cassette subfamily B protein